LRDDNVISFKTFELLKTSFPVVATEASISRIFASFCLGEFEQSVDLELEAKFRDSRRLLVSLAIFLSLFHSHFHNSEKSDLLNPTLLENKDTIAFFN
jgi:hypothetical protein